MHINEKEFVSKSAADGGVVITGWMGRGYELLIPDKIGNAKVTGLSGGIFGKISDLERVVIPSSVTAIDAGTFDACPSLLAIDVAEGSKKFWSDDGILYDIEGTLLRCPKGKEGNVEVSSSATAIGPGAFWQCSKLQGISLPREILKIGERAFGLCTSVNSFMLPPSIRRIPFKAFGGCISLHSFSMSDEVTAIERMAFGGCEALSTLRLSEGLVAIGASAFWNCRSLRELHIPDGVLTIGDDMLHGCSGLIALGLGGGLEAMPRGGLHGTSQLERIDVSLTNRDLASVDGMVFDKQLTTFLCCPEGRTGDVVLPEGTKTIASESFRGSDVRSVFVPDTVQCLSERAFYGCGSKEIHLGKGVHEISDGAFAHSGLVLMNIPDEVKHIGEEAFAHCFSLESIVVGSGVKMIGARAFDMETHVTDGPSTKLRTIHFKGDAPDCGEDCLRGHRGDLRIFYRPGALGFVKEFNGVPTVEEGGDQHPLPGQMIHQI